MTAGFVELCNRTVEGGRDVGAVSASELAVDGPNPKGRRAAVAGAGRRGGRLRPRWPRARIDARQLGLRTLGQEPPP
jgi:hypothetical protein